MNNKYLNCFIFSKSFYNYNVLFLHASKGRLVDILCMFIYIYVYTTHTRIFFSFSYYAFSAKHFNDLCICVIFCISMGSVQVYYTSDHMAHAPELKTKLTKDTCPKL
jgi:hypothetical protein